VLNDHRSDGYLESLHGKPAALEDVLAISVHNDWASGIGGSMEFEGGVRTMVPEVPEPSM